jgi:ComF family protein
MAQAVARILPKETLIAPVPLHWSRMMKRRYNQSALLAKALSKQLQMTWCPDLLHRTKATSSLDGLGRHERFEMLKDSIEVTQKRRSQIIGRSVLVVDDVMTSGATLQACTKALLANGAGEIRVVTLARVAKDA